MSRRCEDAPCCGCCGVERGSFAFEEDFESERGLPGDYGDGPDVGDHDEDEPDEDEDDRGEDRFIDSQWEGPELD